MEKRIVIRRADIHPIIKQPPPCQQFLCHPSGNIYDIVLPYLRGIPFLKQIVYQPQRFLPKRLAYQAWDFQPAAGGILYINPRNSHVHQASGFLLSQQCALRQHHFPFPVQNSLSQHHSCINFCNRHVTHMPNPSFLPYLPLFYHISWENKIPTAGHFA